MDDATHTDGTLEKRLQDPATREKLTHLLDRLDTIEEALDTLERLEHQMPALLQTTADVVDEELTRAADRGVVLDERAGEALHLAEALTEPETVEVLTALIDRLDRLEQLAALAEELPDAARVTVDTIDDALTRAADRGVVVDERAREGRALSRLGELFRTDEFEALLDSGVLDPQALQVVGSLGSALVDTQKEASRGDTPTQGVFGLLGALRDPDVQRAVGFITTLAKKFGRNLRA